MQGFRARLANTLVGVMALSSCGVANAALVFEILRASDTVAQIHATGTLDIDVSSGRVQLSGAASTGGAGLDGLAGNFTLGGNPVVDVFTRSGLTDFILAFGSDRLDAGDAPAGLLTATLIGETWQPLGKIGSVVIEGTSTTLGRYEIVSAFSAAPEPGTFALLGLGLAGLAASRRRKLHSP